MILFMETVRLLPSRTITSDFIPSRFVPVGHDQYTFRNIQFPHAARPWRQLRSDEIETLVKNGNTSDNWNNIRVCDPFDPGQLLGSSFFGFVRIGVVEDAVLEHHDLTLPVGITNCRIVSCDIGDHAALHNVHYLAHYIIGDRSILTNIDEMHVSNHAKFGNGVVKDGEDESVRITLDLVNETGSRAVAPFEEMTTADAYLWARYRDDRLLQERLMELTQRYEDSRRGYYGVVGEQCVIKNTRIIKDVRIGGHCYIKGANKLKNLTIRSDEKELTQIGEGVELVNGIIGYGCRIFYGCKAVRFIMGNNSSLKYGARLIHSFLGDNSTVSCCELLNNLIFPAHEQHHNNSFLVAALVGGQSNIAAGATIGSNHNSRSNDNEIIAGRGFWPGLSTTLKHSSRFASFVLVSKGDYPAELDLPLPFSLLSNNVTLGRLEVTPAFWWTRNMYALARNNWKFAARDTRIHRQQNIHFDAFAPDTVEEIIAARRLIEEWVGATLAGDAPRWEAVPGVYPAIVASRDSETVRARQKAGRALLSESHGDLPAVSVAGLEKSRRLSVLVRPGEGWQAYREMLHHYAARQLTAYMIAHTDETLQTLESRLGDTPRVTEWENLGGQLVPASGVARLREDIRTGALDSWQAIHQRYDQLYLQYQEDLLAHSWGVYRYLQQGDDGAGTVPSPSSWTAFLREAVKIQELVRDRVYQSRQKDYENPYRIATYRSADEMTAAIGTIDDNSFIRQVSDETEVFRRHVDGILQRETGAQ
jgi:hypothetical protein